VNGSSAVLATLNSADYVTGTWAEVTLQPRGDVWSVRLRRADTGQYLTASGGWQADPVDALSLTDTAVRGPGQVGLNRPPLYPDTTYSDDFTILGTSPTLETFNGTAPGALPAGWAQWSVNGSPGFAGSTARSAS